jgi:hypothetical protein
VVVTNICQIIQSVCISVYVENSYLNCYDIVPINIVRLIGQGYLKFLPLSVTNLNKSWPIDKHMKAEATQR